MPAVSDALWNVGEMDVAVWDAISGGSYWDVSVIDQAVWDGTA